jgi:hypothetical protein
VASALHKFREAVAVSLDLRPVDVNTHTDREAVCAWEYSRRERNERPSAFLMPFSAKLQSADAIKDGVQKSELMRACVQVLHHPPARPHPRA